MSRVTVDVTGEEFGNELVSEGWHRFKIVEVPTVKTGKDSGKKYIEWPVEIVDDVFAGVTMKLNTTLDKGDNPKKSKRWLFHQMMVALNIPKIENKYSLILEETVGKDFSGKVVIEENSYNGKVFQKNQVKQVASDAEVRSVEQPKSDPMFKDQEEIPF